MTSRKLKERRLYAQTLKMKVDNRISGRGFVPLLEMQGKGIKEGELC